MNGWTPTIPLKTRLENLTAQVPQEYRNRAVAECTNDNPHDIERALTAYVMARTWETYPVPADEAYQIDGTYPSPIISGGEVLDLTPVHGGDEFPF